MTAVTLSEQSPPPIYLDHHATTPVDAEVLEAMRPWWRDQFGNAASHSHAVGRRTARAVDEARDSLAEDLHCEPAEIIFTSGATEANNLAIKGLLDSAPSPVHVVTSAAEHRAVLDPVKRLQRRGVAATILPVDSFGAADPAALVDALQPQTRLVSIMLANNEVGTINDLATIGAACRARGVWVHTDAAQAFGRIPLDLSQLPVDLVSVTAHKLYGPQGIGALVVRRGRGRIPLEPLLDGGGHERGLRSGTLPVALIVGFAAASRMAARSLESGSQRLTSLRERLWSELQARIADVSLNGHRTHRLPGNLNVTIPGVDGDALLVRLQQSPLAVSSGAACSSANSEPSHVLRAMGHTDAAARASLRFGLGRDNTEIELVHAAEIVGQVVSELRHPTV